MRVVLVTFLGVLFAGIFMGQTPTPTPTPDPAAIAQIKEQNAQAMKLNALISVFNQEITAREWAQAETTAGQLIAIEARPEYYRGLGTVQYDQGKYEAAVASFETSVQKLGTWEQVKAGDEMLRRRAGQALTMEGNAYLKLKRNDDALKAFDRVAAIDPDPGQAYFNLCAVQYNAGNVDNALTACNRSIAANPMRADAWFIKGSLLLANSTADKDGNLQAPAGTVEALKKYLELAPNGPHASDVKEMLVYLKAK